MSAEEIDPTEALAGIFSYEAPPGKTSTYVNYRTIGLIAEGSPGRWIKVDKPYSSKGEIRDYVLTRLGPDFEVETNERPDGRLDLYVRWPGPEPEALARPVAPPERLIDIKAVATWLNVTERTVRHFCERDGLPVHRLGAKIWRFRRSDVEKWLAGASDHA